MKSSANIRYILTVFFKHKFSIFGVLLGTLATVTMMTLIMSPVYEASSILLVKFGRSYVYQPEVGNVRSTSTYFSRDGIINAEIEIITSHDLHRQLIKKIGVEKLYPDLYKNQQSGISLINAAVQKCSKNLSVLGAKNSNIIRIAFQHGNPKTAAEVVNLMVDLFQEKHLKTFKDPKTSAFLEEKAIYYQNRLEESEIKIETFKQNKQIFSHQEQLLILLRQRANSSASIKDSQSQIVALEERLKYLKNQMQAMFGSNPLFTETDRYEIIDNAKKELLSLKLEEQELLGKLNQNNPKVVNVRRRIEVVKEFLKKQEKGGKRAKLQAGKSEMYHVLVKAIVQTKADLKAQKGKASVLERQLKDVDQELQTLTSGERELRNLKRELINNEQNYQTYRTKLEENRILDEMDRQKMTNIRVVQTGAIPTKPIKPKKKLNILIGFMLGLFGGLGVAFFKEYLSQGLNSIKSVEKHLNLPVLAIVGDKENNKNDTNKEL